MILAMRWAFFIIGLIFFSLGISITVKMQHLGLLSWDILNVALFEKIGLSIGSWSIIIGLILVCISWVLDKSYVKVGTFLNILLIGSFVDFFLWLDFLPEATHTWTDVVVIVSGVSIMGVAGGLYNAGGLGSGPRDGFMLSISEKLNMSISKVRIIIEIIVILIGLVLGGPVFVFTFILTFVQSPIFQYAYLGFKKVIHQMELREQYKKEHVTSTVVK